MANLTRWQPLFTPNRLQRDINHLFDRFFGGLDWPTEESVSSTFMPAMDISETDDHILVRAELPGIDPKDIDVSLKDDVLTIKGEKKQEKEVRSETQHRVERSHGSFCRSFRLPASVVFDKTAADYKNGVLEIILPKADEAKRREVKIKVS